MVRFTSVKWKSILFTKTKDLHDLGLREQGQDAQLKGTCLSINKKLYSLPDLQQRADFSNFSENKESEIIVEEETGLPKNVASNTEQLNTPRMKRKLSQQNVGG